MDDVTSEAKVLAKWYAKRTGAPLSACTTLAAAVLDCASLQPDRNAMAVVLGVRLLAESLGVVGRSATVLGEDDKASKGPATLDYRVKEASA